MESTADESGERESLEMTKVMENEKLVEATKNEKIEGSSPVDREICCELMKSLSQEAIVGHDHPSRIPVPVHRAVDEVPLERKETVTLIEADENSVITLMSTEITEVSACSSMTCLVEEAQRKVSKKNSKESQLESQSKASFVKQSVQSKNPGMKLPHKPGHLPDYLKNHTKKPESPVDQSKGLKSASITSRMSTAPSIQSKSTGAKKLTEMKPKTAFTAVSSAHSQVSTAPMSEKKKTELLQKTNENLVLKNMKLNKEVDELKKFLSDSAEKMKETESALATKEHQLRDKYNRIRDLEAQKQKLQLDSKKVSDESAKIIALETQLAALQKEKDALNRRILQKESTIEKQKVELKRLEKELEETLNLNEEILAETKNKEAGDDNTQAKYERSIRELKGQLKQRDTEISSLKRDSSTLNEENRSLKTQSLEFAKIRPSTPLARDSIDQKKNEDALKLEINKLKSLLEDANHKNFRHENLLQLRGEYIKTLQDTDEVNKSRLLLQMKDNEDLRMKVEKLRKFKAATNEELNNMKNTLTSQEREIEQLRLTVEFKDEKIQMMKQLKAQNQMYQGR